MKFIGRAMGELKLIMQMKVDYDQGVNVLWCKTLILIVHRALIIKYMIEALDFINHIDSITHHGKDVLHLGLAVSGSRNMNHIAFSYVCQPAAAYVMRYKIEKWQNK